MNPNTIKNIKAVAGIAVQLGSGTIVARIVQTNVPVANTYEKVTVTASAFALGGLLAEQAKDYTHRAIDDIAALFDREKEKTS